MNLETERLYIVDTPLHVIRRRLELAAFEAEVRTVAGLFPVRFPPEWPGDPLAVFSDWAEQYVPGAPQRGGTLIRRADLTAIGMIGDKGDPGPEGDLDIGYGLNPEAWNSGYATEVLRALLPHWLASPGVRRVTADTARTNPASARVLEKCGFVRVGEGWNEDDGDLILWAALP